jgi:hypothetical protein
MTGIALLLGALVNDSHISIALRMNKTLSISYLVSPKILGMLFAFSNT